MLMSYWGSCRKVLIQWSWSASLSLHGDAAVGKCWVGPSSKFLECSSFVCFGLIISAMKCLRRAVSYKLVVEPSEERNSLVGRVMLCTYPDSC